jgi:hypothetical protein
MLLRTGVIHGGQVRVSEPIDLPDGSEVTITAAAPEKVAANEEPSDTPEASAVAFPPRDLVFMTEDEQSDDPEAIRQWLDDLRSLPPVPETPEQAASRLAWEEQMRQFNCAAMRKQFESDAP